MSRTCRQFIGECRIPYAIPRGFQELMAVEIDARTTELQGVPQMPGDRLEGIHQDLRTLGNESAFWASLIASEE